MKALCVHVGVDERFVQKPREICGSLGKKNRGMGRDPLPKLKVAAKNSSIKLQTTA